MRSEASAHGRNNLFRNPDVLAACRAGRIAAALCLIPLLSGCGTLPNGRSWGQDASLAPGWERIGRAAKDAALATETWAPAAGALALQIGNADRRVQEWAAEHTPVFGSQQNADRMSDNLVRISGALWLASGLATPSGGDGSGEHAGGDEADEWLPNKARGLGVQTGAGVVVRSTVGMLKDATKRTRPNGLGQSSFPSNHASQSAVFTTMASENVGTFGWSDNAVSASRFGLGTLTAATAWARVEADQHYPSDVLAGIALGHFFGAFITGAFLGVDDPNRLMVMFEPTRNGHMMIVRFGL